MRVLPKLIFLTLMTLLAVNAKSQDLLNSGESQINKAMLGKGGILKVSKFQSDLIHEQRLKLLIYKFPKSTVQINDILAISFYLTTKNRCIHYSTIYKSDRFLKDLVDKFDSASSGLTKSDTKSGFSMKWINKKNKYEVYILKTQFGSNGTSPAFALDISNYR